MAISFPPLPQVGDTFASGDKTWKWNGLGWEKVLPARPFYGIAGFYDGAPEAGWLYTGWTKEKNLLDMRNP